jgi:NADH pyrophosphatase NudC (nudix superfamily)
MSKTVMEVGRIVFAPLRRPEPMHFPTLESFTCQRCGKVFKWTRKHKFCYDCASEVAEKSIINE